MDAKLQNLRERTGAGVMECKRALEETAGDLERAVEFIRARGLAKMEKRAGRGTGAGLIVSYVHNEKIGVLVDVRAETDFVVRSEPFRELARELAMHIAASAPKDVHELLAQPYIRDEAQSVDQLVKSVSARVGENIAVYAFARLEL